MYFGDAAMGSTFGDKRGVTIDTDSSVYFTSDAIALRATERFDINCHEVGSATEAGPMIGIDLAAS
jgi:HK97 family phage major capsid protein